MKRFFQITVLFLGLIGSVNGQVTNVLFVGNSYTYSNDLPGTLYNIALSLGDTISHDSSTPGGANLESHTNNITTLQKIGQPGWDYVIIQAQSQEPSFSPGQVASQTFPYARILDSLIHDANPCAITMFYMTWGRKYGDAINCPIYPPICTFEGMTGRLRESYLQMATDNFARVSPVGMAWKYAREQDSTINLWSGDNSHPSPAGTYLAACVFYASIFKQSPVGATYTAGLSAPDALFLQQVADQTVFDSVEIWRLNENPINAAFTYNINGGQVDFINTSYNGSTFSWDFGDGNTSNSDSPSHTYGSSGVFSVQLIVSNACYSDTIIQTVDLTSLGVDDLTKKEIDVFPNPTSGLLFFTQPLEDHRYQIFDLNGRIRLSGVLKDNKLNLSNLSKGVYHVVVGKYDFKVIVR